MHLVGDVLVGVLAGVFFVVGVFGMAFIPVLALSLLFDWLRKYLLGELP